MANATTTITPSFRRAIPFWVSLLALPLVWAVSATGGPAIALVPLCAWPLFSLIDAVLGTNPDNADPETPEGQLFWYRVLTLIWGPLQFLTVFGIIAYVTRTDHLVAHEELAIAFGLGVISGTVGIVYAHELLHQKSRLERLAGDFLLAMVLYSHFRSEHLLVHHRHVGTPRDAVTARYNENFYRYFVRVLREELPSAWRAEKDMLARRNLPATDFSNPFWFYAALQLACLGLAFSLGDWWGLVLFVVQALVAVWQLQLVNYVEHYGLTRKHLGDGKYEPTGTHHSWNATHKGSNWLLINLQRHADHHTKPNRRFPLLQAGSDDDGPQLPYGYPIMTAAAMVPPLWRRRMNPRVRAWRKRFYPEISDWQSYNTMSNPSPR